MMLEPYMREPKVSIVIPIYNVEPYLERCLLSVTSQTWRNLEILLIDDGSPDGCPRICDEWAEKDSRIRVIHKENAGLGMARNTGIENATGEFICFYDSDDYIAPHTIEHSVARALETGADTVVYGVSVMDPELREVKRYIPKVGARVYEGEAVRDEFLPDFIAPDPHGDGTRTFYMSAWVLLYSTELIARTNFRFVSEREIISEDVYSLLSYFRYSERVAVLPESLYRYCDNGASLSRSYRPDRYEKTRHFYLSSIELCDRLGYGEEIKHRLSKPYLAFTISALKGEVRRAKGNKKRLERVRAIADDTVLREVLEHNKHDRVSLTRKILFFALRARMYRLCAFLLGAK